MAVFCLLYLQDKRNPLHSASMDNNVLVVEELIKSGEDVNNVDKVWINTYNYYVLL